LQTRTCSRCRQTKTIRGVWYLLTRESGPGTLFVCETCFRLRAPADVAIQQA